MKLHLFSLLIFFFSSLFREAAGGINTWCNRTPFPEPCKYSMSHGVHHFEPKNKSDFQKMAVQLAMAGAVQAASHNKGLGPKCRNKRERTAWRDCLGLYENAIIQLNQTLYDPDGTNFDTQTWLSAALTNVETCRNGFSELDVRDLVLPMISNNNVSKLICNSLALYNNNSTTNWNESYSHGFPTWVLSRDRRLLQAAVPLVDAVVAQDGSGQYRTIQAAVDAAARRTSSRSGRRFVIRVKSGIYRENVMIGAYVKNIMLVGDGLRKTIITGSRSVGGGYTTFSSATFVVFGDGFIARDMTFRNTAGPQNSQAVAFLSGADHSVFHQCSFEGYQDTLYVHSQRQFYRECYIHGTIDFIFGNAAVILQNCIIYARRPMPGQRITITAQGRSDPNENTGILIHNSRVLASSDFRIMANSIQVYLGRPWKQYSRTVFLKTYLDSMIDPTGWMEWEGNFALSTLYYGEYRNLGPGARTSRRVRWRGYHVITNPMEASRFSTANFLAGRMWLPATGVPFTSGL